jgi:K+-sensing histidine kinase KdpD
VIITPIRDQQGTLLGFAKVTRDMTERRRAREELINSQQEARELVLANAAKDEFLGIVAHELRTPVSTLYGSAQFLRSHYDVLSESDKAELIGNLAEESSVMRELIENLLSLARPPTPDSVDLQDVDVGEVVSGSIASFERRSPNRTVTVEAPEAALRAMAERTYLDRVVQNLLDNADKYSTPQHPIEIALASNGAQATVEVRDRGPGVDPAELNLIFNSFYRSPRTATGRPGKGLGLTVCKRLTEAMGGSIEARPRMGGGLVIRVSLPLPQS